MKKNFFILILIIAVSINIAGAKLVFTDKKLLHIIKQMKSI